MLQNGSLYPVKHQVCMLDKHSHKHRHLQIYIDIDIYIYIYAKHSCLCHISNINLLFTYYMSYTAYTDVIYIRYITVLYEYKADVYIIYDYNMIYVILICDTSWSLGDSSSGSSIIKKCMFFLFFYFFIFVCFFINFSHFFPIYLNRRNVLTLVDLKMQISYPRTQNRHRSVDCSRSCCNTVSLVVHEAWWTHGNTPVKLLCY